MTTRLPTCIGIASVNSGSTSIHRDLGEHPEVFVSRHILCDDGA